MNTQDRSWILTLYRAGSVSTVRIERVKHCWTDDDGRILVIAQYDSGVSGSHHYLIWRTARLDWWRMERSDPNSGNAPIAHA